MNDKTILLLLSVSTNKSRYFAQPQPIIVDSRFLPMDKEIFLLVIDCGWLPI